MVVNGSIAPLAPTPLQPAVVRSKEDVAIDVPRAAVWHRCVRQISARADRRARTRGAFLRRNRPTALPSGDQNGIAAPVGTGQRCDRLGREVVQLQLRVAVLDGGKRDSPAIGGERESNGIVGPCRRPAHRWAPKTAAAPAGGGGGASCAQPQWRRAIPGPAMMERSTTARADAGGTAVELRSILIAHVSGGFFA